MAFNLVKNFSPSGDQPQAIEYLSAGIQKGIKNQTLVGATGTGKTFTMANVIKNVQKPTLILSHNKTLAAQLFAEFKDFFPDSAVEYFVSYYDYYQPEAYVPQRDLYIEKDSDINEVIERYRNSATQSLLSRPDTIIVSTVSCIYGLGDPEGYQELSINLKVGESYNREKILVRLRDMQYERTNSDFLNGMYRVRGEYIDVNLTTSDDKAVRLIFFGEELEEIKILNPISGEAMGRADNFIIFPAKHYVSPQDKITSAISIIREDLEKELKAFRDAGKLIEEARLKQRVNYDLEMLEQTGFTKGIENYSRYIDKRAVGTAPSTLLDYFADDYLMFIDESHITVPQIGGMYEGDKSRKQNLVDYGFRMKSAMDNRPLKFEEFKQRVNQIVYVSATPSKYELALSKESAAEVMK